MSPYDRKSHQSPGPTPETPADLVFDDDPIDSILYADMPEPPTPASIFAPARTLVERMTKGQDTPDFDDVLFDCEQFLEDEEPLTPALYTELCEATVLAHLKATLSDDVRRNTLEVILQLCIAREIKGGLPPIVSRLFESLVRAATALR